jgi:hypothetical protein
MAAGRTEFGEMRAAGWYLGRDEDSRSIREIRVPLAFGEGDVVTFMAAFPRPCAN